MSLSVLTSKDWDEIYVRSDYERVVRKDPTLPREIRDKVMSGLAEYLLAFDQPDEVILAQIKKNPARLLGAHNPYGLHVLDLAILKGRKALVAGLLDAKAPLDKPDAFGWLPIHHAALASSEIFELLVKKRADTQAKTPKGGTCEDLRHLAGLEELTISLSNLRVETDDKTHVRFDYRQFGMTKYTDRCYFAGDDLKKLWMQTGTNEVPAFDKELYKADSHPPKVLLKRTISPSKNWGVFAAEHLALGRGLFFYSGQYSDSTVMASLPTLLSKKVVRRPYVLGDVDAEKVGNAARFLNEGFPNCLPNQVVNYKGHAGAHLLAVSKDGGIAPGEELLWDYGLGEVALKWNSLYHISNAQEMREFIQSQSIEKLQAMYEQHSFQCAPPQTNSRQGVQNHWKATGNMLRFVYCLFTPAAILDLWCNNIITAEDWIAKMAAFDKQNKNLHPNHHRHAMLLANCFLIILQSLERRLSQKPQYKECVKAYLNGLQAKRTLLEISEIVSKISIWLEGTSSITWDKLSAQLLLDYPYNEERDIDALGIIFFFNKFLKANNT